MTQKLISVSHDGPYCIFLSLARDAQRALSKGVVFTTDPDGTLSRAMTEDFAGGKRHLKCQHFGTSYSAVTESFNTFNTFDSLIET